MDEWIRDRDKFMYFPEGVVRCKCAEYHLELKGTNPREQSRNDAEEASVDLLLYNEESCTHCRVAKEINSENSMLSESVKTKIIVSATNATDFDRLQQREIQIMALVGTYTCYKNQKKSSYKDVSVDGYKMRMIKNIIQSLNCRQIMQTDEDNDRLELWNEIRKWIRISQSKDLDTYKYLYPNTYNFIKERECQKNSKLSMESLKRVGELINKCIKKGIRIKTPDNDILEYHHINKEKNIDQVGASFHSDKRAEGINVNDFGNTNVEEEMFGKALFTVDEKNNRRANYWCDDCQQMQTRSNFTRHVKRQHNGDKSKVTDPTDKAIQTMLIRDSIKNSYMIYCVLCNGTYTTEQWTLIHLDSRSHCRRSGKKWKRKLGEPANWKLRPDAEDKECDDDTESEMLKISPKIFGKKRKRSDEASTDVAVKRPRQNAMKEIAHIEKN